jgi:hypothetical protein
MFSEVKNRVDDICSCISRLTPSGEGILGNADADEAHVLCDQIDEILNFKFVAETPKENGFYWIEFKEGRETVRMPCRVEHVNDSTHVRTFSMRTFMEGPGHGGPGLKYQDDSGKFKRLLSIRFGPKITLE